MLWLPSWLFEGAVGPCGQASTSLQVSVFSYPCTRQRSGPVMGTRWGFMCLNKDTFWTIRNNWVAVYTLNPNLTAVHAHWPRRNRAEPFVLPWSNDSLSFLLLTGEYVCLRWGCVQEHHFPSLWKAFLSMGHSHSQLVLELSHIFGHDRVLVCASP